MAINHRNLRTNELKIDRFFPSQSSDMTLHMVQLGIHILKFRVFLMASN